MGRSARREDPPWEDLPKHQWELLWKGEEVLRKFGPILWEAGHRTITLFPAVPKEALHRVMRQAGDGSQTRHAQVPITKRIPAPARQILQAYLNLVDWEYLLEGGSRESTQEWATSSEIIKWQDRHRAGSQPSRELSQRITDIIHESSMVLVQEELEEIKELLDSRTPITWLSETLIRSFGRKKSSKEETSSLPRVSHSYGSSWHSF